MHIPAIPSQLHSGYHPTSFPFVALLNVELSFGVYKQFRYLDIRDVWNDNHPHKQRDLHIAHRHEL